MLCLFCRKKRLFSGKNSRPRPKDTMPAVPEKTADIPREELPMQNDAPLHIAYKNSFATHMSRYIGETVTIFVNGGGISGIGFTGVLLTVNDTFVRLISRPGPAPSCSLGSICRFPAYSGTFGIVPYYFNWNPLPGRASIKTLGSITCIPIGKIVSFIHNAV